MCEKRSFGCFLLDLLTHLIPSLVKQLLRKASCWSLRRNESWRGKIPETWVEE